MLLTLGFGIILALILGFAVATEDYTSIEGMVLVVFAVWLILFADYIPMIAFGLISPFNLPIPFVSNFPLFLAVLVACLFKYMLKSWLSSAKPPPLRTNVLTLSFGLFFAWVLFRYSLNPALPNITGFGANVTGFRAYMSYGICFAMLALLGVFVRSREDVLRLLKWLAWICAAYCLLLIPCAFSKSESVGMLLSRMGMFVATHDNGMLRFVMLPGFGTILITLARLPSLLPMTRSLRICVIMLGSTAIVVGGNRSGLAIILAILLSIPFAQRRFIRFGILLFGVIAFLSVGYVIGETVKGEVGLARIFALVSDHLSQGGDAAANVEWRRVRWERAWNEIQESPLLGSGYGGLENAWVWADEAQRQEASVEISLAAGGVHNGYLNCAMALGIPALILFLSIFIIQLAFTFKRTSDFQETDSVVSQLYCFTFVNLVGLALAIYIGDDLNEPVIWFYLGLSVLVGRIVFAEQTHRKEQQNDLQSPEAMAVP